MLLAHWACAGWQGGGKGYHSSSGWENPSWYSGGAKGWGKSSYKGNSSSGKGSWGPGAQTYVYHIGKPEEEEKREKDKKKKKRSRSSSSEDSDDKGKLGSKEKRELASLRELKESVEQQKAEEKKAAERAKWQQEVMDSVDAKFIKEDNYKQMLKDQAVVIKQLQKKLEVGSPSSALPATEKETTHLSEAAGADTEDELQQKLGSPPLKKERVSLGGGSPSAPVTLTVAQKELVLVILPGIKPKFETWKDLKLLLCKTSKVALAGAVKKWKMKENVDVAIDPGDTTAVVINFLARKLGLEEE